MSARPHGDLYAAELISSRDVAEVVVCVCAFRGFAGISDRVRLCCKNGRRARQVVGYVCFGISFWV